MAFPTIEHLLGAFLAAVAASIAAIPIYVPSLQKLLSIAAYTWAPVWAMNILELDVRALCAAATKTIIAAWFGMGAACLSFYLATLIFDADLYKQHAIALVLMLPFTIIIRSSFPDNHIPLSRIMRWDVGLICAYMTAAFGKTTTYWTGTSIALGFTIGAVSAVLVVVIVSHFRPQARSRVLLKKAIRDFQLTHAIWLEQLIDCMHVSTADHGNEMQRRQEEATKSFKQLQSLLQRARHDFFNVPKNPANIGSTNRTASALHMQIVAMRGALSHEGMQGPLVSQIHTGGFQKFLWETKEAILVVLRPNSDPAIAAEFRKRMLHNSQQMTEKLFLAEINRETTAKRPGGAKSGIFRGLSATNTESEDALIRFVFVVSCIGRIGELIDDFLTASAVLEQDQSFLPIYRSLPQHFVKIFKSLFDFSRMRSHSRGSGFMVKAVVVNEILAQGLVALMYQYPQLGISKYWGWAIVGYLITFLPTVGQAIVRGSRRFLGTLVGSAFMAIVAVSGTQNAASMFGLMVVTVFVGKFASYHPVINYAGIVYALCQLFEILPLFDAGQHGTIPQGVDLLTVVLYRTICMCVGVGYSMLCACLVFPHFDSTIVRRSMARSILLIADLAKIGLLDPQSTSSTQVEERDKKINAIQKEQKPLASACSTARSEMFLLRHAVSNRAPFHILNIIRAEKELYKLAEIVFIVTMLAHSHTVIYPKPSASQEQLAHEEKSPSHGPLSVDEKFEKLFEELRVEFVRVAELTAEMILHPDKNLAVRADECVFDWSSILSHMFDQLGEMQNSNADPQTLLRLQNLIFSISEFLTGWDCLVNTLDPKLAFRSIRARTGIVRAEGVAAVIAP